MADELTPAEKAWETRRERGDDGSEAAQKAVATRQRNEEERGLVERLLGILLGVAIKRSTITYGELAPLLGLNIGWANHRAQLGDMLGAVGEIGSNEWGILLPSIAVGKGDNMPSGRSDASDPSGFYAWCADNGKDISNPEALVVNEQRKVYNFAAAS